MKSSLRIPLHTLPEQAARLRELQKNFADVCNALAPVVRDNRCWNRVTLHHLTYHGLRQAFPGTGSQMICNAIYAVSLSARSVFQHPDSPFHLSRLQGDRLPLLHFADDCPVYFDRHTLSLKGGQLSMYTLDGRLRFNLSLRPDDDRLLQTGRVRQITLSRRSQSDFELVFLFGDTDEDADRTIAPPAVPGFQVPRHVTVGGHA